MAVQEQSEFSNKSTANGLTGDFPYTFKILRAKDLRVEIDGVLVDGLGSYTYTVSGVGADAGGNVAITPYPPDGAAVLRAYDPVLDRETNYQYVGDLRSPTINGDFDRIWLAIQSGAARSFRFPLGEKNDENTLPGAADRAGRALGFDAFGKPIVFPPPSLVTSAAAVTDAAGGTVQKTLEAARIDNIAVLRTTPGQFNGQRANVTSYYAGWAALASGPRGGGDMAWDATSTAADDNFLVFAVTGVTTGRWKRVQNRVLTSYDAGARGDYSQDDSSPIQTLITAMAAGLRNAVIGDGGFRIDTHIVLTGAPCSIIGEMASVPQQGITRPACNLRWQGGAGQMFLASSSGWRFIGFSAENFGTATDFCRCTNGQRFYVEDVWFLLGSGASRFSRSIFRSDGNNLGYSVFNRVHFLGAAPAFFDVDGMGATNGLTPLTFTGGLYESNSGNATTILRVKDTVIDAVTFTGEMTFNQQDGELCIVDTTSNPLSTTITSLVFMGNELDTNLSNSTDRYFKLTNVKNFEFNQNVVNGGGVVTAIADLVNTSVSGFDGNFVERVGGPFFNADATSRVSSGVNDFNVSNTAGVVNDAASASGVIPATYGPVVTIKGQLGDPRGATHRVDVTDTAGFTLAFAHPGIQAGGYLVRGQHIDIQIRNLSGGVIPSITLAGGATLWAVAGGALTIPTAGNYTVTTFVWDGSKLNERARSGQVAV